MSIPRVVELSETYHILRELVSPGTSNDPSTMVCRKLNAMLSGMSKAPGGIHQLRPYVVATALYLVRHSSDIGHLVELSTKQLFRKVYESADFDKYLSEATTLLEDAPANAAGMGAIAGLGGDPPVARKKKRKRTS